MLLLDRERAQQRVRLVDLDANDTDTDLTLGGDDKSIEHGDVQILHRQLGCAQQRGDRTKLRWPRRSQFELGHGSSLSADDGAKLRADGDGAPETKNTQERNTVRLTRDHIAAIAGMQLTVPATKYARVS